jgi:hypothetical protein
VKTLVLDSHPLIKYFERDEGWEQVADLHIALNPFAKRLSNNPAVLRTQNDAAKAAVKRFFFAAVTANSAEGG